MQSNNLSASIATAYHEAGHAVVASVLGLPLDSVTIEPGTHAGVDYLGRTSCPIPNPFWNENQIPRDAALNWVAFFMAGPISESQCPGYQPEQDGDKFDREFAMRFALAGVFPGLKTSEVQSEKVRNSSDKIEDLRNSGVAVAHKCLVENGQAIREVVRLLLEAKSLTGADVAEIIRQNQGGA